MTARFFLRRLARWVSARGTRSAYKEADGIGSNSSNFSLGDSLGAQIRAGYPSSDRLITDFRFSCDRPNLPMLSDAFIHAGSDARNQARRIYTQWVKNKRGRFSSVSTGFLKVGFPRVAADLQDGPARPLFPLPSRHSW